MEASEGQSRQISSDNNYTSVYSVKQTGPGKSKGRNQHSNESFCCPKKWQTSSTQCSRCGIKGHTSHECRCSRNVTCHKCHKFGHFASVCRSNSTADRKQHGSSFNSHDSRRFPGKRSNVCYVGDDAEDALRDTNASTDDDDDSYTDEYAYALDGCCSIPVVINGVGADIVTDSGTSCNTINTDIAKQPLKKSARSLTIVPVSYIRMVFHQSRVISSYLHLSRLKVASLFRLIFSLFLVTRPTFGQRDKREARRTFLSNPNPNPKVLQTVIELCNTGRWHEINKYDVDQAALRQFQNVRDELTVNRHGNVLLRNTRIIMPTSLQARAVQLAHEGHQGTSKSKALINSKVWFPGIDTAVDDAVRRCIPCQANTTRQHRTSQHVEPSTCYVDQPQHTFLWSSYVWSVLDGHYR